MSAPILDPQDALLALADLEARIRAGSDKAAHRESCWLWDLAYDLQDIRGKYAAQLDDAEPDPAEIAEERGRRQRVA